MRAWSKQAAMSWTACIDDPYTQASASRISSGNRSMCCAPHGSPCRSPARIQAGRPNKKAQEFLPQMPKAERRCATWSSPIQDALVLQILDGKSGNELFSIKKHFRITRTNSGEIGARPPDSRMLHCTVPAPDRTGQSSDRNRATERSRPLTK